MPLLAGIETMGLSAFRQMRLLAEDQCKRPDRLACIALGDGERHRVAFNLAGVPGWMTVLCLILTHGAAVLSDVCASQLKVAGLVSHYLLVNHSMSTIILDLTTLRGHLKADVLAAPCTYFRAVHFAARLTRLLNVLLMATTIPYEESYHERKGQSKHHGFGRLIQHTGCFSLRPYLLQRACCR
jgi:hypothetical protein